MRKLSIIWFLLLFISIIACTSKSGKNQSLKREVQFQEKLSPLLMAILMMY
ncbi:MAG TPA: hypothetical protein PLC87_11910 [Bacteroidales bacterium]|nr:hypothetical protein [Bacteroidales bacterium]